MTLVESAGSSSEALSSLSLGLCWPNRSPFADHLRINTLDSESLDAAAVRLDLSWSPHWLFEAGYSAVDGSGVPLASAAASASAGAITWTPEPILCRLDDQVKNSVSTDSAQFRRRIAGEVAVLALWSRAANACGLDFAVRPPEDIDGNTRGALFRDLLVNVIQNALPAEWSVAPEVPLTAIRGLHMRRGIGGRRSDIVVIDSGNRLVAVVSSKWTWRSDRGTEAAQMVPLMRYRPDVPYVLVTGEFPRARVVSRESIEDRAYHIAPTWVGAWLAVSRSLKPREEFPTLEDLDREGAVIADALGLPSLADLLSDLTSSGTIL